MQNQDNQENQQSHHNYAVLGGKAYVFKRDDSKYWQAATYLNGRNFRNACGPPVDMPITTISKL